MKNIEVSLDVFSAIWAARLADEQSENDVLVRVLGLKGGVNNRNIISNPTDHNDMPPSKAWKHVLTWSLEKLGGEASLQEIYSKSREARRRLGINITREHNASARECLESHSSQSEKYRKKEDLFYMPRGKGNGYWGLLSMKAKMPSYASGSAWRGQGVLLQHGVKIRMKYKGKMFNGEIDNGRWLVDGKRFKSPSDAAAGVAETLNGKRTSLNGWIYWEVQIADDGSWTLISNLR